MLGIDIEMKWNMHKWQLNEMQVKLKRSGMLCIQLLQKLGKEIDENGMGNLIEIK